MDPNNTRRDGRHFDAGEGCHASAPIISTGGQPMPAGLPGPLVRSDWRGRLTRRASTSLFLLAALCWADRMPAAPAAGVAWITLGTGGGPLLRAKRGQASNALVASGGVVLFDAGEGLIRGLALGGVRLDQVRGVVLSHLHPDHTGGLAALITLRWQNDIRTPMVVYGPIGTAEIVSGLLASNAPAERVGFASPGTIFPVAGASVSARELPCMGETTVIAGVEVTAVRNTHYVYPDGHEPPNAASCSFRAVVDGKTIIYTGDTGPSDALTHLATGADLLVSEVIDVAATMRSVGRLARDLPPQARAGMTFHLTRHHLTPEEVGRMAAAAGVKSVVLTHLSPGMDDERDTSGYVDGVRLLYHGPVHAASDGERFSVPTGP